MEPYVVYVGDEPLGSSFLEHRDPNMGVAFGVFAPAPAYERIRWVFRLFAEAQPANANQEADAAKLSRYYSERDKLNLRLIGPATHPIATSFIHIEDFMAEAGEVPEALQVTVQLPGGVASLSKKSRS